jgi:phage terminase small subunit
MNKELTPKEQKFAELCVTLGNQTEAYRQAYNPSNNEAEWLKVEASKLATQPNISLTIQNLKLQVSKTHGIDRSFILQGYLEIISDADYTFRLGADNELTKEDKQAFYRIMNQTKNTDKLRALESISKMMGLNEPEVIEHKHIITTHTTSWNT